MIIKCIIYDFIVYDRESQYRFLHNDTSYKDLLMKSHKVSAG